MNSKYTQLYRAVYYLTATDNDMSELPELLKYFPIPDSVKKDLLQATKFEKIYRRDGVIVLKNILSPQRVENAVNDIWKYILSLPYKNKVKKVINRVWQGLKDDPWRKVTAEEISTMRKHYPMTGGFGALTLPPAFHTHGQWDARQDPVLVAVHQKLYAVKKLKVTFDRISFKMPGQGETEFTHWDSNPWTWPEEEYEGMQGILALSKTTFRAVPRTHTKQFRKRFIKLYPRGKRHDQYHVTSDNDPLKLQDQVIDYSLGTGDFVLWSNRLLHEARINKTDTIRYAYFISYYPKGKPNANLLKSYEKKGINMNEERENSFISGTNPTFFPSGTEVKLYSASSYMYHPHKLNEFCDQFQKDVCGKRIYQSGKKKGQSVQVPIEYDPVEMGLYEPPKLTQLGYDLV